MRALVVLVLLSSGCYQPDPVSGAYLCSADDSSCPDGTQCVCNQCVKKDSDAACSFAITSSQAVEGKKGAFSLSVEEHQPFPVSVQALDSNGNPASGFNGTIKLSSTWGDVCVGSTGCIGLPDHVTLSGGKVDATIQLNRETIPPQSALLRAELAGNVGTSGKLRITVTAPKFARDSSPIVAPLTVLPPTSFGFATIVIGGPSVIKTVDGWKMFFTTAVVRKVNGKDEGHIAAGVATSTDGKSFTPPGAPLYEADTSPDTFIGEVSAYDDGDLVHVFSGRRQLYLDGDTKMKPYAFGTLVDLAVSPPPILVNAQGAMADCAFCTAVDTPTVIRDPNPAFSGGGPKASVMFFSALTMDSAGNGAVSVVRAESADGVSYDVDPSPILQSTRDETVIYSPRVIVDGTVYKLFYSTTPFGTDAATTLNPCLVNYHVGYATSTDGLFWVRSPTNAPNATHVLDVNSTAGAWDKGNSLLVGSVVPKDGVDPSSGLVIYYSPFQIGALGCLPNGVGRAERR